jgi:DNA helicase-2/ATP-dependent DNA helicase PcrA
VASDTSALARLLNPQQLAAATHGNGPLLILAGAGSGKTRVLTHRIAHLVREGLARPSEILAVTFTNKAAGELRERVEHLVGEEGRRLWVATFHAAGARILRREAEALSLTRDFTIYDDGDQLAAVKRVCADLDLEASLAKQHLGRIDRWKNAGLLPDKVVVSDFDVPGKAAQKVYARYQKQLQAANAVDFGDLIVRVSELFERFPEVRQRYASRFRHVLVDEFQDTNPAQYHLLRLIAAPPDGHGNLCVVGDDDQSIYRWRGAEVDNILDFAKHFANTTVVKLEQNYRSTGNILNAAHAVIEKNPRRTPKKLWTAAGAGERLRVQVADDERDEGARVAQEVYAQNARGTGYGEMAVFYRANAQSRALEDALRARRVPYRVVRGRSFYERAEVKDVAAYLRLCVNPRSDADLLRVVNVPARGIGDATVEALQRSAGARGLSLWEALEAMELDPEMTSSAKTKLAPFRMLVRNLREQIAADPAAATAIELVLKLTSYEDRLRLEGEEGQDRIDNLHELIGAARDFDHAWQEGRSPQAAGREPQAAPGGLGSPQGNANPAAHVPGDRPDASAAFAAAALEDEDAEAPQTALVGFLEQLALVGDADAETGGERVSLMTLHAAKGLEFDAVWLTGLEERVFPNSRARVMPT